MNAAAVQIDETQNINILQVGGRQIEVNQEGYLVNFDDWDEEVAKTMAAIDHLELSECHWHTFNFLREYYPAVEKPL